MCTSLITNKRKTIIGWNLDLLDMEWRVNPCDAGVFIEVYDYKKGWMPLFGATRNGDFVGMPTCHPADNRSDPRGNEPNIILLDIDLLTGKKTLQEIREIVENGRVCSVPGHTFMGVLSDRNGNCLQIVPGQGCRYYEKPEYLVTTNFSPFKMDSETHPWMGWDRYQKACELLSESNDDFDVNDCFSVLRAVSQTVCPTVVSMVFDVTEGVVYWCEKQQWGDVNSRKIM